MGYALSTTVPQPFAAALAATRDALSEQGFGILTEIDLSATLKEKLDATLPPRSSSGPAGLPWPMRPSRRSHPSGSCSPATSSSAP